MWPTCVQSSKADDGSTKQDIKEYGHRQFFRFDSGKNPTDAAVQDENAEQDRATSDDWMTGLV